MFAQHFLNIFLAYSLLAQQWNGHSVLCSVVVKLKGKTTKKKKGWMVGPGGQCWGHG